MPGMDLAFPEPMTAANASSPLSAMTESLQQVHYARLHHERALWVNTQECLAVRFPHAGCNACVDTCPIGALQPANGTWALSDDCVGCGRCAARCPTEALVITGFDRSGGVTVPGKPLRVDCERVPSASSPEGALRLPCLGGLGTDGLLRLFSRSPAGVTMLDRGLCPDCPAGGGPRLPVSAALDEANGLLGDIGVSPDRQIRIEYQRLPDGAAPAMPPPQTHAERVTRRGLWKALAAGAVRVREPVERPDPPASLGRPAPPDGSVRATPSKRLAVIARLRSLADDETRALPARLFPSLAIGNTCQDHNLCVHLCPTGALELAESDTRREIHFDPERCIECAACIRACPEGAINWGRSTDGMPAATQILTARETRVCGECGAGFVDRQSGHDDEALPACPACRRSRQLMQSVFTDLFARRLA
jgi:ferredoxin